MVNHHEISMKQMTRIGVCPTLAQSHFLHVVGYSPSSPHNIPIMVGKRLPMFGINPSQNQGWKKIMFTIKHRHSIQQ